MNDRLGGLILLLGTWGPPEEAPIKHPAIQKTDFARNEKRCGGGGGRCDRERMLVPPTNSGRGVNDFGPGGSVPHTGDQDTAISVGLGATSADQRGRLLQTRFYHIYINIHQLEADLINLLNY